MSRNTNSSHSNDVPDLVIMVLIAFYALPFIGMYLLTVPGQKDLGITLIVTGIALWIVAGAAAA